MAERCYAYEGFPWRMQVSEMRLRRRLELFDAYRRELELRHGSPLFGNEAERMRFAAALMDEPYRWRDIHVVQGVVGFVVLGLDEAAHPDCDVHVSQAYVHPAYRRRGLLSGTIRREVRRHGGVWTLDVVSGNEAAAGIWRRAFASAGYEDASESVRRVWHGEEPGTLCMAFAPSSLHGQPRREHELHEGCEGQLV